jgi:hypothetical protein
VLGDWLDDTTDRDLTRFGGPVVDVAGKRRVVPVHTFGYDIPLFLTGDGIHVSEAYYNDTKLRIIEPISTTLEALTKYLKLLETVVPSSQVTLLSEPRRTHSSRYVSEPALACIQVWLRKENTRLTLPKLFVDYLSGAFEYLGRFEWRTSVTLSAIAVETVLAELFEEEFQERAPEIPLGGLLDEINHRVKDTIKSSLMSPIKLAVAAANELRVAAVHRGSLSVSQKEATDALRAATKVVIWYHLAKSADASNERAG